MSWLANTDDFFFVSLIWTTHIFFDFRDYKRYWFRARRPNLYAKIKGLKVVSLAAISEGKSASPLFLPSKNSPGVKSEADSTLNTIRDTILLFKPSTKSNNNLPQPSHRESVAGVLYKILPRGFNSYKPHLAIVRLANKAVFQRLPLYEESPVIFFYTNGDYVSQILGFTWTTDPKWIWADAFRNSREAAQGGISLFLLVSLDAGAYKTLVEQSDNVVEVATFTGPINSNIKIFTGSDYRNNTI